MVVLPQKKNNKKLKNDKKEYPCEHGTIIFFKFGNQTDEGANDGSGQ
jgi:hypothetical protein